MSEGTPFCPQCGAPQIRVRTDSDSFPAANSEDVALPSALSGPDRTRLIWRSVFPKAAACGLLLAALVTVSGTPILLAFIPPFCAALSGIWYGRQEKTELTAGMGARLGAVTGFFGFLFQSLMFGAIFLSKPGEIKASFHKQIEEAIARNPNPQAQAMAQNLFTPQGILAAVLLGLAMVFVFYLILGSVGGAIGSSFTRRKSS